MSIVANGSPPVCANCGCPHVEILQFGHPKGDGRFHRKRDELASGMVRWILRTSRKEVLEMVQLECPYCNFWHGIYDEYPSEDKRPNWNHVEGHQEPFVSKIQHQEKYPHRQQRIDEFDHEDESQLIEIKRTCSVCGKPLVISFNNDSYLGGHYFGKMDNDEEYWECDDCYNKKEE
jgi:hypothetical protein